ncbi:GNAT family N-acetyltransferase [Pontiella sulfatireligans]|uniref:Aminoalkylphosphonate N-acetyltransferase n=1 Tax=Pontiella sulfatireligans TaxID=2750658 RepID=A0A6C2UQR0_9BACT|nr:GNAT family N-acetyltransferase [Pontiella sulfatireligans]VGO22419.1 Aminoalkylphosphonate N-acetyltransferase [Pontiella sulfatireligans]
MNTVLRKASASDLPAMIELLSQLFSLEADFAPNPMKQVVGLHLLLNRPDALVLVAEQDGAAVGMCTVQRLVSTAEGREVGLIEDVVVLAKYRGRGIGSAMLAEAERWAVEQGLSRLQLLADRCNAPALEFYRKHAWKQTQLVDLRRLLHRS